MRRLREVFHQWLICKDQEWQVRLVGVAYLLRWTNTCPSADETISSYVGRGELRGDRWALILAPIIDRLFILAGEEPGHCRRNIELAFLGHPPTP